MFDKDLVIITNEKISKINDNYSCDNIDLKSIPEGLSKTLRVSLIAKSTKIQRFNKINIKTIIVSSNLFFFLKNIFKTFKNKKAIYLIISISPFTFFSSLLLYLFRKNFFVYLRSNGYEEYKSIFGFLGPIIYHLMYLIVTLKSNIIICQKRLFTKRESQLVFPSELNRLWSNNISKPNLDRPRLLYVGRIKIEKGVFSLLNIYKNMDQNIKLSILGKDEKSEINDKNINLISYKEDTPSLIKIFDEHNITILPSFTEAHPKVIDESLSRNRPVIIFDEISHVVGDRKGIFISKRNAADLVKTIEFIMNNFSVIFDDMSKNKLPTKEQFISRMTDIIVEK
tara:strand:- start:52 stop:1071 length:1020 start_codon:yes stop_codon:yes gene_type:complete